MIEIKEDIENEIAANLLYTPYECAAVVNAWFLEKGIERTLPPQMFYTYTKKEYIESILVEGKVYVELNELQKWFVRYTQKNVFGRKESLKIPSAPEV